MLQAATIVAALVAAQSVPAPTSSSRSIGPNSSSDGEECLHGHNGHLSSHHQPSLKGIGGEVASSHEHSRDDGKARGAGIRVRDRVNIGRPV